MTPKNIAPSIEALRQALLAAGRGDEAPPTTLPGLSPEIRAECFISRNVRYARHDDSHVEQWLAERRATSQLQVRPTSLGQLARWRIDPETGNIGHETGRFFTLIGLKIRHRFQDREIEWDQPFIDQPEVGILGILAKRIDGILHFCLQAKEEPGNIGRVQLSPTVQATYSNYSGVHGGARPPFVEQFISPPPERVLFAKLQTEDGGRFLYKSNRNMIVRLGDDAGEDVPNDFIWLTLRQIALCMQRDSLVNACARSILASLI